MPDPAGQMRSAADVAGAPRHPAPRPAAAGRAPIFGLLAGVALAAIVRLVLLPTQGFRPDLDQFVLWVHDIATAPLGDAYRQNLSFPPVMTYIFALLGALDPAFRTVTNAADPAVRVVMKLPALVADMGLAAVVAYVLRDRPRWAAAGALAILLHPAILYVSAWWGQFESIYLLPALLAWALAASGRPVPGAVALAVSLMTKPQALPFLVPYGAFVLARNGWRGALLAGAAGLATMLVLWLPFVQAGGPLAYVANLAAYQGETYPVISLRAWNAWWLLQEQATGGFVSDATSVAGPVTVRWIGLAMAGLGELLVFAAVLRRPTARGLALGLACATLVAFSFLTTMHERYAFGAIVFLAVLLPEARIRWTWLALSVLMTLNLVAAIPATPALAAIPLAGPVGAAGSIGMLAVTVACAWLLFHAPPDEPRPGAAVRNERQVPAEAPAGPVAAEAGTDAPEAAGRLASHATTGMQNIGKFASE